VDVAEWLRQLGLERYEAAFRENDVTVAVLPSLTAEDLKELGVTSIGHRRKLLQAIAAGRSDLGQLSPAQTFGLSPNERRSGLAAERRQLCVMFCDMMDFTGLSSRLDPEDLSEVIRGYQERVAATITRFGGFIARYVGDGVLIYFGWPEAHEANAERAIRAALSVIDAISQAPIRAERLQVRIGIATGLVIVGEPIGDGDTRQQTMIGETPNLAARLQNLAEPDGIVIDAVTRRQIGGLFECRDLGMIALKGLSDPVPAWQVLREAAIESRFEALHARTMTPLIGRDEEFDLLLRRWQQAKEGEGQLVLLSGEPGIGKSRLIAAVEERLRSEPHENLRYFCSPHHQDSALYPITARWEHDLNFARSDTPQDKLHKLETALKQLETAPDEVTLIADLLSVPVDDRYPQADLDPQRKKEKTFEALLQVLANRARRQPVLMLFEDAHWADVSSIELLDRVVVGTLTDLPILVIVSFRPEFQPPWVGLANASLITLQRLTLKQAEQLAQQVIVERALSPDLLERIVVQTDGVPLFIEELTKAVVERTEQSGGNAAPLEVPATLQASLIARFDRLPAAKQIAQIGAVIGREFAHPLLAAIANTPEAQLTQGIEMLVSSGLAFRHGTPPDASYTFKHALVRDAAYSTLLRNQRQKLHARIATELEEHFPEVVDTRPEVLGHHCTQAGLAERAIEFWHLAGLLSVRRSANAEAAAHFASALNLLGTLPAGEQRDAQELDLTLSLAVPLIAVHGFGSSRVEECALRAKVLSDRLTGSPSRFAARRLAWNSCLLRQPLPKTVELARDLATLADEDKSPAKLAVARRSLGYSLLMLGRLREANEILSQGAALADTIADREFTVYGEHPSMVCRAYSAHAKIMAGLPASGARLAEMAVAFARREKNAHSLAWALTVAAHAFTIQDEPAITARFASEGIETARDHRMPQWLANGERCMGWAMHRLGDFRAGFNLLMQGIKRWNDTGAKLHTTHYEMALADCLLREGRIAEARLHLNAARAHCESYGEAYLAAEIDRLEGVLLQSEQAATELVEEYFMKSLSTAGRQGAHLFALRTSTTFARMLADKGERRRAIDILAPAFSWFTEGFETTDLAEAKTLLDGLT
jgi:class 3 adenylate cyclase/tetratricopeptide (TPR) repeat protein